ncbi:MAG: MBL fold metallo-hydrolase [Myxococcales bacterium]|nr:MBL fold metallo-hydrolase [Myxococcales bacterium]
MTNSGQPTPPNAPLGAASVAAGPYTVRGISVAGIYTSIAVPQLDALFDIGVAMRSSAGCKHLFLSHAHADHIGALGALLGMRGILSGLPPLRIFLPAEIVDDVTAMLAPMSRMQRYGFAFELVPMLPDQIEPLYADLSVQAHRTFHPVPSLAFSLRRTVQRLRPEFSTLPGREIAERRRRGDDLFTPHTAVEIAYATDTLVNVLDGTPALAAARVLILECSFLDERKDVKTARAGCHIHLEELIERASLFTGEHLVLMHPSQLFSPAAARAIIEARLAPLLTPTVSLLAPTSGPWFG